MDEQATRVATPFELASQEEARDREVRAWLEAYLNFPTAENFDGVLARMRAYQSAWMNGRKRP